MRVVLSVEVVGARGLSPQSVSECCVVCSVSPRDASGSELRSLTRKTPPVSASTSPHWEERFDWTFFFPLVAGVDAEESPSTSSIPPPALPRTVVLKVKDAGGGASLGKVRLRIAGAEVSLGEVVVMIGRDMVERAVAAGGTFSLPRQFYPLQRRRKMSAGRDVAGELRVGVSIRIPALDGQAVAYSGALARSSAFEGMAPPLPKKKTSVGKKKTASFPAPPPPPRLSRPRLAATAGQRPSAGSRGHPCPHSMPSPPPAPPVPNAVPLLVP